MTELGIINKLINERNEDLKAANLKIGQVYGDKLTKVFSILYSKPNLAITWELVELQSKKVVNVSGRFQLEIGEVVKVGEESVTVTAENQSSHNRFANFTFPIIMLETATVEELVEFVNKISNYGAGDTITSADIRKMIEDEADTFENALLENPERLEALTKPKRPQTLHGFSTEGLTDNQFLQLSWYNHDNDKGQLN
ncbi:hypothetical protein [Stenotrophomonas phage RAS14]